MDDARIQALTAEVLADLRAPAAPGPAAGGAAALEARVAALETALRSLGVTPAASAPHPSLQLLGPAGGGDRCVLEPDKPCVGSGQCRTFGH